MKVRVNKVTSFRIITILSEGGYMGFNQFPVRPVNKKADQELANALKKATSIEETALKAKHVRSEFTPIVTHSAIPIERHSVHPVHLELSHVAIHMDGPWSFAHFGH